MILRVKQLPSFIHPPPPPKKNYRMTTVARSYNATFFQKIHSEKIQVLYTDKYRTYKED